MCVNEVERGRKGGNEKGRNKTPPSPLPLFFSFLQLYKYNSYTIQQVYKYNSYTVQQVSTASFSGFPDFGFGQRGREGGEG